MMAISILKGGSMHLNIMASDDDFKSYRICFVFMFLFLCSVLCTCTHICMNRIYNTMLNVNKNGNNVP